MIAMAIMMIMMLKIMVILIKMIAKAVYMFVQFKRRRVNWIYSLGRVNLVISTFAIKNQFKDELSVSSFDLVDTSKMYNIKI